MNPLTLGVLGLLAFVGARRLARSFRVKVNSFGWFGLRPDDEDE